MTPSKTHRLSMVAAYAATILIALLAAAILGGCSSQRPSRGTSVKSYSEITKVAHRGGSLLAPENTLSAFQRGIDEGCDAIELDVHLSSDGELIVIHDPLLNRTTTHSGAVSDYTADQLTAIDARASYKGSDTYPTSPIPSLEEVLKLLVRQDRQVNLQLEIKVDQRENRYPQIEERVVEMLQAYDLIGRTVIISFDFPTLQRIRELEPRLELGALISRKYLGAAGLKGGPDEVADSIAALGVEYVGINFSYLSDTLYQKFRERGLGVGAWTVNTAKDIKHIASMGVDFITSDRPDLLTELLQ